MSTEKLIVAHSVAEYFIEKFRAKMSGLIASDPATEHSALGSMVNPGAAERIDMLIQEAIRKGATLHEAAPARGTLRSAAILDAVTADMRIYSEESFGPIVVLLRAVDDEEAIRLANDSDYGLTAAVFSSDIARALKVAERLDVGMCHINGATVHDEAQMPFGGMKQSGYGRFGGRAGIAEFTELRWITISTQQAQYPI